MQQIWNVDTFLEYFLKISMILMVKKKLIYTKIKDYLLNYNQMKFT